MNLRAVLALCLICLAPAFVHAHGQSTALVRVEAATDSQSGRLQVDLALIDLEAVLGLDANADGEITWGEVRRQEAAIVEFVRSGVRLHPVGEPAACPLQASPLQIDTHADGSYAVASFTSPCLGNAAGLRIQYELLFGLNASHRVLVSWTAAGEVVGTHVLANDTRSATWSPSQDGFWSGFSGWVGQGVWHIWTGYDHLLFLATLLLPAVVRRRNGTWLPQESLADALRDVIKVVTAFTLAHSASLLAGALGWITPDSRWVESGIALTVLLGALNLLFPVVHRRLWAVALGFGLIHGLGFASTLSGLGLSGRHLVRDLLAFNLGVELGQLAVIALFVPLAFSLRHRSWYRVGFTPVAACAIGVIAAIWLYQRAAA